MTFYKEDTIRKALFERKILENSSFEVKVDPKTFVSVNFFIIVFVLISNIALLHQLTDKKIILLFSQDGDFIKQLIQTQIEVRLLQFSNTYQSFNKELITELDDINNILLALSIQDYVEKEIKKIIQEGI